VLELSKGGLRTDPRFQAELGVRDTAVEKRFLTGNAFLTPADQSRVSETSAGPFLKKAADIVASSPQSRLWMERDVDSGFSILVPNHSAHMGGDAVDWWRVKHDTGETLGMLADGTGGATAIYPMAVSATEYLIMKLVSLTVTAAFAAGGYHDCVRATQEEQCCMEMAVGGAVTGGIIGFGVAGVVAFELTIAQLFWMEVGINAAVGLYSSLDFWAELCQTAIFGQSEQPFIGLPIWHKGARPFTDLLALQEPQAQETALSLCMFPSP
jgi:hypothetical protein